MSAPGRCTSRPTGHRERRSPTYALARAQRELEITVRDQRIEIEVVPIEIEIVERDGAFAAVPATTLPPLTLEQVRDSLEGGRR